MKYLSDTLWGKLPIQDFRPRFFIESYMEKLSLNTPHFSQSRLMNLFSSCAEALSYVNEYQLNEKNGGYILTSLDEIDSCLAIDPIANNLFTHMEMPRTQLFKKIRGGDFNQSQLDRLSVICRAIISRETEYSASLLAALKESILGQYDLTHKARITSNIYTLTGLYTTHLLNRGYSPTYLFNRGEMFTRESNYSGKNFQEQFELVTERLRSYTTSYDVFFTLRAHKPSCLLSINDDPSLSFLEAIPEEINGANREKLCKEFVPNVVARASIETTDHVTASWRTKDKLDKLLDTVTALELNPKIQVSAHCVTISRNQALTHTQALNINLLLGFLSSEGGTYFSNTDSSIRSSFAKLNDQGKDQLGRSLRYLRLARESVSLEQKLLNLWIALESLFSDGEASILVNIIEYVPQIYAVSSLVRRVRYLRDLLVRANASTTPLVQERQMMGTLFDQKTTDAQVFGLLLDEEAAIELFDDLGVKEHLKFKLLSTFDEMKSNAAIAKRVKSSEVDVARQLRRIYFLRNKIAHTGHYSNIRPQLVTHLLDYVAVSYMAISTSAAYAMQEGAQSIGDLFAAYKMGADVVVSRANSPQAITRIEELAPIPII